MALGAGSATVNKVKISVLVGEVGQSHTHTLQEVISAMQEDKSKGRGQSDRLAGAI